MVTFVNSFDGIVDGTAVTLANSGGPGQKAFDAVSGSVTAKAEAAALGPIGLRAELSSSTESYVAWTTVGNVHHFRTYIRTPATEVTHNARLVWSGTAASSTNGWDVRHQVATNVIAFCTQNTTRFTLDPVLAPSTVYRLEGRVATGSTGTVEVRLYDEADTLLDSDTFVGEVDDSTQLRYGLGNGVDANQVYDLDDIGYSNLDWIGADPVTTQFTPPSFEEGIQTRQKPLSYFRTTVSVSVVRVDGTFTSIRHPYVEQLDAAGVEGTDFFIGGHIYQVSQAIADELVAAGYAVGGGRYGTGPYGSGPYGGGG